MVKHVYKTIIKRFVFKALLLIKLFYYFNGDGNIHVQSTNNEVHVRIKSEMNG